MLLPVLVTGAIPYLVDRDRDLEVKSVAGAGPMAVVKAPVPDSVDDLDPVVDDPDDPVNKPDDPVNKPVPATERKAGAFLSFKD